MYYTIYTILRLYCKYKMTHTVIEDHSPMNEYEYEPSCTLPINLNYTSWSVIRLVSNSVNIYLTDFQCHLSVCFNFVCLLF